MLILWAVIWLAMLLFFRINRIWVFYYILGVVGGTILIIIALRGSFVEYSLESYTGYLLNQILYIAGIKSYIFDNSPGTILVLLDIDNTWTTIGIDIECSGLLESCVFVGLLVFYPAFSIIGRTFYLALGIVSIYLINIVRLLVIVSIITNFGRDSIYIAHTLFGRIVFFGLVIIVYWYVFTRASLIKIREYRNV